MTAPSPLRGARAVVQGVLFGRWPRVGLAVRTAAAAALAWQLALWLPFQAADTYPYYAPLGAVVGSYSSVRSSVSNSLRAVLGIVAGAVVALAAELLFGPDVLVIAAVVAVSTLLAGWAVLGEQRSWVLTASLFVLIIGAADPVDYVTAYTLLTFLGGAVAVGVNALLPEIPLVASGRALEQLSGTLAGQLDDLAEALRRDTPPEADEWRARVRDVRPLRLALDESSTAVQESLHGNVRTRRNADAVRRWSTSGTQLANLAERVEELTDLIVEVQGPSDRAAALGPALRGATADVLAQLAAVARSCPTPGGVPPEEVAALREQVQALSAQESAHEQSSDRERQTAGAVVTLTRRCLGALHVEDEDAEGDDEAVMPTPWALPADPVPTSLWRRAGRRVPRPSLPSRPHPLRALRRRRR